MDPTRHFISIADHPRESLLNFLDLAARIKSGEYAARPLAGKTLAMLFSKSSTRTRVSFEVGTSQLGGHALFLSARDLQLGRGEPIRDTARVLSRYVQGIMIRTFHQSEPQDLAEFGSVPVINGLTDLLHPCQIMADLQTIRENFGPELRGISVAWIGDGNNVANSWLNAAAQLGFPLRLACPAGYTPDSAILQRARGMTEVLLCDDPRQAAEGADVVTTDVWASMGQEEQSADRVRAFAGYEVNEALMERASQRAIFLHCLPAHRGEEVSEAVLEGPRSRVWDEAENRLHAQKAIMVRLMGDSHG